MIFGIKTKKDKEIEFLKKELISLHESIKKNYLLADTKRVKTYMATYVSSCYDKDNPYYDRFIRESLAMEIGNKLLENVPINFEMDDNSAKVICSVRLEVLENDIYRD